MADGASCPVTIELVIEFERQEDAEKAVLVLFDLLAGGAEDTPTTNQIQACEPMPIYLSVPAKEEVVVR